MNKNPNATRKTWNPSGFLIGNILGACIVAELYDLELSLWFVIPAIVYSAYFAVRTIGKVAVAASDARRMREEEAARVATRDARRATREDIR